MRIRYRSKTAAIIDILRAIQAAFGGVGSIVALILVAFSIISIGWFSDALYRIWFADTSPWYAAMPFLLVFILAALSLRQLPELTPKIEERISRKAKGMIMFLSPTNLANKKTYHETDILNKKDPWEMPLKAIKQHWQRNTLEYIVVIPSCDTGDKDDGTWRKLEQFRHFIDDVVHIPWDKIINHEHHSHGVDFESAQALWESVGEALELLHKKGIDDKDIVIDITGGQKMAAVMGGVVGLGKSLRLQYVSTKDHRILEYDITMQVER